MTREEAEEFWASEDDARKDYPGAIRSFVGTVQSLAAVEKERDELRATVARVEALAESWAESARMLLDDYDRNGSEAALSYANCTAMDHLALRAALHPEQEAHDA